ITCCISHLFPQLSSGNSIYDKYYRQVDPSGSGRVSAADAALFLKRSGLADLVLGKIWDLADSERKGCLNKQQFFIALRLVACAQNGLEVAIKNLHLAVPPPKFHDTSSPLLPGGVSIDSPWVVKMEEKLKFDAIFDSLSPVNGMLSGEKVKPVLLNSKLPVDVLGRVWELSDLDRDGMLDRDEFAVAMYLVYRALEGEPVPMSLPAPLVPPSKRKKPVSVPPVMPLLPSPPSIKERRSSVSGSKTLPSKPPTAPWVVSLSDKAKYDEVFAKTDLDMDGLVSGPEVRDIFLKTGLPSATLARIWELCDIGDMGKLTREQFALALHLIHQKLTKGVDPPQNLSPEMVPPSDRLTWLGVPSVSTVIKYSCLLCWSSREKGTVEQEIKEKEERIRERTSEVQELQKEVQKESGELQRLQSQRQQVQEALEDLDQQKSALEEQLGLIRQQCSHENQLISSLQAEHTEQEQRIEEYEEQLVQAREELLRLQEETQQLEEKVQAAREQLSPLQDSVQQRLSDLQLEERTVTAQLSWKRALEDDPVPVLVNGTTEERHHHEQPEKLKVERPASQPLMDGFLCADDPFKDDPFGKAGVSVLSTDPFGGDPFKGTDPFAADAFFKQSSAAPFLSADPFTPGDPFGGSAGLLAEPNLFAAPLNNTAGPDPFSSKSNNTASRDPFSAKVSDVDDDPFASKTAEADLFGSQGTAGPDPFSCSPPGKRSSISRSESSDSFHRRGPFLPKGSGEPPFSQPAKDAAQDPFAPSSPLQPARDPDRFASFDKYHTEEDMIEWAKRESEREEKERLARLTQQEQEDLELAIALSKSEFS
uniref:Epidermal growth factor receptor pathway substrate 15 n=1 Tax=Esox lucius TaxID=8010 RepID=A0A6Q2WS41_ESOLU